MRASAWTRRRPRRQDDAAKRGPLTAGRWRAHPRRRAPGRTRSRYLLGRDVPREPGRWFTLHGPSLRVDRRWLLLAVGLLAGGHLARRVVRQRRDEATLGERSARGGHLPRSLHPVIDPDVCIGSLSCLRACPEGDILGVVGRRLVHGDHCIGHGAARRSAR